ncbi:MAG: acetate kinase [Acidobacteriota bacterium]|nr:acetate kinase [Acidobacteriota bacterium]MDE3169951.1 acetate kinase [Acidobacteriota bacterium]
MNILVLNSGSSSQKAAVYCIEKPPGDDPQEPVWQGRIEWDGTLRRDRAQIEVSNLRGARVNNRVEAESRKQATSQLLASIWSGAAAVLRSPEEIAIAGHRVVNGGREFRESAIITPAVKGAIERMAALAPLHNRAELDGIETLELKCGNLPQVAVFDTAFHSRMPDAAAIYPGPYEWTEQGIRRFGFHGINHQYCTQRAARMLRRELARLRMITCHLGNGCSLAAIRDGHSIDTTMGFTPLEGLMMGTRSGSVDPGILTHLMRRANLSGEQIDELLNHQSGLLGISGVSGDMREIVAAMKQGHARAKLAFDIFVHRLKAGIGAMAAALGGVDALIFSAGIGENSPEVRAATCAALEFLDVKLDAKKNENPILDADVSAGGARVRVLVIRAQEDWAIARECWRLAPAKARSERRSSESYGKN